MAKSTDTFPRDEEVLKKIQEALEDEDLLPSLFKRYTILELLMEQKSDEEITDMLSCAKATVASVRKKYLEGGLEALQGRKPGKQPERGPAPVYQADYDCDLVFGGTFPTLAALFLDDDLQIAVLRTSSRAKKRDDGSGRIRIWGKQNISLMNQFAEDSRVPIFAALHIMMLSTIRGNEFGTLMRLNSFLDAFYEEESASDKYTALVCFNPMSYLQWELDRIPQLIPFPCEMYDDKTAWQEALSQKLSHTKPSFSDTFDGKDTKQLFFEQLALYTLMRSEGSRPFIWWSGHRKG